MILEQYIQKLVREKSGLSLTIAYQFDLLSTNIFEATGEMLSVNTLKRLFGFLPEVNASKTTLNILAQYLGYKDWEQLIAVTCGENSELNDNGRTFFLKDLPEGTILEVTYEPQRKLKLQILSDKRCLVLESAGGKLLVNDILDIYEISILLPLVVKNVIREEISLGNYIGGIEGGVKSVHFIHLGENQP